MYTLVPNKESEEGCKERAEGGNTTGIVYVFCLEFENSHCHEEVDLGSNQLHKLGTIPI